MLTVACVQVSNYLGRGAEYVEKLRAMVDRNLDQPHRFECITESDKPGWWAKVELFSPGRFSGRVLYMDLDSVITGPLDSLAASKGIIDLRQWGWKTATYGSGVMVFDGGEHAEIWDRYTADVPKRFRGDQDYLTSLGGWVALPDGMTRSYRYHCTDGPPAGCAVCCMHGSPKPHEITTEWVPRLWA